MTGTQLCKAVWRPSTFPEFDADLPF